MPRPRAVSRAALGAVALFWFFQAGIQYLSFLAARMVPLGPGALVGYVLYDQVSWTLPCALAFAAGWKASESATVPTVLAKVFVAAAALVFLRAAAYHYLDVWVGLPFGMPWGPRLLRLFPGHFLVFITAAGCGAVSHQVQAARRLHLRESVAATRAQRRRLAAFRSDLEPGLVDASLGVLARLVRTDGAAANTVLARIADCLRSSLHRFSARQSPLRRELDHLARLCALEASLHGTASTVLAELSGPRWDAPVPVGSLHPLSGAIRDAVARLAPRGGEIVIEPEISLRESGWMEVRVRLRTSAADETDAPAPEIASTRIPVESGAEDRARSAARRPRGRGAAREPSVLGAEPGYAPFASFWLAFAALQLIVRLVSLESGTVPYSAANAILRNLLDAANWPLLSLAAIHTTRVARRHGASGVRTLAIYLALSAAAYAAWVTARCGYYAVLPVTARDAGLSWTRQALVGATIFTQIYGMMLIVTHLMDRLGQLHAERMAAQARHRRVARSEFDRLQAQMHPHFLFNTMNSIAALIPRDRAAASGLIQSLRRLLATILTRPQLVTLDEELALLAHYVAIERRRLHGRLQVRYDVPGEARTCLVPALLLQPLVENAIRHGIGPRPEGGCVWVSARVTPGELELRVADDGVGLDPHAPARPGGVGIANTMSRLEWVYSRPAGLRVEPRPGGGTLVTVRVPRSGGAVMPSPHRPADPASHSPPTFAGVER